MELDVPLRIGSGAVDENWVNCQTEQLLQFIHIYIYSNYDYYYLM